MGSQKSLAGVVIWRGGRENLKTLGVVILVGCARDRNRIIYNGSVMSQAPVLSSCLVTIWRRASRSQATDRGLEGCPTGTRQMPPDQTKPRRTRAGAAQTNPRNPCPCLARDDDDGVEIWLGSRTRPLGEDYGTNGEDKRQHQARHSRPYICAPKRRIPPQVLAW